MYKSDEQKVLELLLYVADKTLPDPTYGATKLNKILFYSDFYAYWKLGKPISGQSYRRLDKGPVLRLYPKFRAMLESDHSAIVKKQKYHSFPQARLIALRDPDLSHFTGEEIEIIQYVIECLWKRTATEVSDLSHEFMGWKFAREEEDIPYETAFLSGRRLSDHEYNQGRVLACEGWG